MDCILGAFDVVKDGRVISHYELFERGYVREVRSTTNVICVGAGSENTYKECLETNRQIAAMIGAEIVEKRDGVYPSLFSIFKEV